MKWRRDEVWEDAVADEWKRMGVLGPPPEAYRAEQFSVLMGRELIGPAHEKGDLRWHLSLQHSERIPTWGELVEAAHTLRPGVWFTIAVPPGSYWLNVHPRVIHLWEIKDDNLIEMWKTEGRGDTPT